jgi:plastocyanin domain-containing protein
MQKLRLVSVLASISLSIWPSNLFAADMPMPTEQPPQSDQFQRIEQPLMLKIAVTAGGMALIGGQLWWFLGKQKG